MTDHLAMTPADRRKKIRLLQEMVAKKKRDGDKAIHDVDRRGVGFALWDEAHAVRWALGYVERHVSLQTGELTISLEPEEVG